MVARRDGKCSKNNVSTYGCIDFVSTKLAFYFVYKHLKGPYFLQFEFIDVRRQAVTTKLEITDEVGRPTHLIIPIKKYPFPLPIQRIIYHLLS